MEFLLHFIPILLYHHEDLQCLFLNIVNIPPPSLESQQTHKLCSHPARGKHECSCGSWESSRTPLSIISGMNAPAVARLLAAPCWLRSQQAALSSAGRGTLVLCGVTALNSGLVYMQRVLRTCRSQTAAQTRVGSRRFHPDTHPQLRFEKTHPQPAFFWVEGGLIYRYRDKRIEPLFDHHHPGCCSALRRSFAPLILRLVGRITSKGNILCETSLISSAKTLWSLTLEKMQQSSKLL